LAAATEVEGNRIGNDDVGQDYCFTLSLFQRVHPGLGETNIVEERAPCPLPPRGKKVRKGGNIVPGPVGDTERYWGRSMQRDGDESP
jgi:hypothetical protein